MALATGRGPQTRQITGTRPPPPPLSEAWIDALVLAFIIALFGGLIALGRQWSQPFQGEAEIELSFAALPGYALLTLSRGFAAYILSLAFTLVYGSAAAHSRRAERIMIPILDILQGIPVLTFLPTVGLALIGLFPGSNVGLELSCVVMIFTGQAWNMTFSYYGSVKAIPKELIEVARLHRFGWWKRFRTLEAPSAAIGLVWNSMMSMAGGWFFIPVLEFFDLTVNRQKHHFQLPGIGSYMMKASLKWDVPHMLAACAAMTVDIVVVDQLLWRPLIVWTQKFKNEETASAEKPTSWIYDLVRRSHLVAWVAERVRGLVGEREPVIAAAQGADTIGVREATERAAFVARLLGGLIALAAAGAAVFGGTHLARLLAQLAPRDWLHIVAMLGLTTLRVAAAMAIGAAWTVPLGLLIGRSPRLARISQPLIQLVASFPVPMLFPIIAPALVAGLPVSFGVSCTALMLLGTQWYILFNVVAGAMAIPQDLREVASVYELRGLARFRILYLSGIFPYLVTGLITAAGGAWNASIISELVTYGEEGKESVLVAPGIGSLIWQNFNNNDAMFAGGVLVLSAALVVFNRLVWKPLYRLADTKYALNR